MGKRYSQKSPSISVKIPADLYFKVRDKAREEGRLIIILIQKALESYLSGGIKK